MSATIALVRIQLHFIKWPLVILTTSTFILCLNQQGSDVIGVLNGMALISLPLLVWLVGPVLFGSEYVEGAKDYIDTKPVSINQVFWTKMLFLIPFVVYCVFLYSGDMFVRVYFLNMALAGVAMTVLFRDMVRGILTGPIAAVVFGALILIPWYVFCGIHTRKPWEYTDGECPWMVQLIIKLNEYFLPGLIILSPLIFLWATRWMYQFRRTGSWCPPLDGSILLVIPCLLYGGFVNSCGWHEGTSSYIHSPLLSRPQKPEPFRSCLARVLVDNQQRYISLGEKEGEFIVHEVSDLLGEGKPKELFRFSSSMAKERIYESKKRGGFHGWRPWIDERNIVLLNNESDQAVLIEYNSNGMIKSNTISLEVEPSHIVVEEEGKLRIHGRGTDASDTHRIRSTYREIELNLSTGEVLPVSVMYALDSPNFQELKTKSSCFKIKYINGNGLNLEYGDISGATDTPAESLMLRLVDPTIDGSLVAAIYMERVNSASDRIRIPEMKEQIYLYDTSVKFGPKMSSIPLPFRLSGAYIHLYHAYRFLRAMKDEHHEIGLFPPCREGRVTLGGGFLFYWALQIGRVAVWDVRDLTDIKFIGISNCLAWDHVVDHSNLRWYGIHPVLTPQIRSDGALGLIVDKYGPIWLEFPALMHKT